MDSIFQLYSDPALLIEFGGLFLILLIIYLETGFFLGLVLPGGDYLVFTTGLLCGTNHISISLPVLILVMMAAAILGDYTGYLKGRWLGPKLFNKPDSRFFKREYLVKTRHYYEKYGVRSFVLGRFLPVIRTLIPILAGASHLRVIKFSYYNVLGATAWIGILTTLGYFLGDEFPGILRYSVFFILGFLLLASLPALKILKPFKRRELK
jgi:membrane-associated protein